MKATVTNVRPHALRSAYEDLRAQVLAGGRGPGLAIFLHHGMREWMEVCASCAPAVAAVEQAQETTNPQYVLPEMRSEIVSILAGLFLRNRGEANR
ncbi:MAG: hypothetical protein ACRDFW_04185 [bacterium]